MTDKKSQTSRPDRARKQTLTRGKFHLNAHQATVIVGLISLVGVLSAATISNWDKLRGSNGTQVATPDVTEDLLAYNKQRREMVESAFNQALVHVQEAEKRETGPKAEALRNFDALVRERKAAVQRQYDKILEAIKAERPIQAEINKTELNTIIADTQRKYDEMRVISAPGFHPSTTALQAFKEVQEATAKPTCVDSHPLKRRRGISSRIIIVEGVRVKVPCTQSEDGTNPLPGVTFPMGGNRNGLPTVLATSKEKDPGLDSPLPVSTINQR